MKYDIAIVVEQTGIRVAGCLTLEPVACSEQEVKDMFDELQSSFRDKSVGNVVVYQRGSGTKFPAEAIISEAFYTAPNAVVTMQILEVK